MSYNLKIPESDLSDCEDEKIDLLTEIAQRAQNAMDNLLPDKSRLKYEITYKKFMEWMSSRKIKEISQTVVLAYFDYLSEKGYAATTLWATYSMLRNVIHTKHCINIHDYAPLIQYLKKKSKNHVMKKSQVLSPEHVDTFIQEAPDDDYLAIKIALIFGIQGACRRHELCDLTVQDVIDKKDMIIIKIPKTKNDKPRTFVVTEDHYYQLYKKYAALRPSNVETNRFFLQYHKNKCTKNVIGINNFGNMPKTVAKFLNLPDPNTYTGHTFRRTSATLLVDAGADMLTLKRHGGWKSDTVAEGYIENSIHHKIKIAKKISNAVVDSKQDSAFKENSRPVGVTPIATYTSALTSSNTTASTSACTSASTSSCTSTQVENDHTQEEIVMKPTSDPLKNINLNVSNSTNVTIYLNTLKKD